MELIAGVPLDQYAREHDVDARGRLELVARVCDAVQHAHERGVIQYFLPATENTRREEPVSATSPETG